RPTAPPSGRRHARVAGARREPGCDGPDRGAGQQDPSRPLEDDGDVFRIGTWMLTGGNDVNVHRRCTAERTISLEMPVDSLLLGLVISAEEHPDIEPLLAVGEPDALYGGHCADRPEQVHEPRRHA